MKIKGKLRAIGASNHCDDDREENDFYATSPLAVEHLLELEDFSEMILEPCVGQGHIAEVLKNDGHNVIAYDVVDRGYKDTILTNFLNTNFGELDIDIVTNPPYKNAKEFVEKSLSVVKTGRKVAMFLKLVFLEGQSRYEFFKQNPPKTVYVYSKRIPCAKNGEFTDKNGKKLSSTIAYAWFVWEKGYIGETKIKWINY